MNRQRAKSSLLKFCVVEKEAIYKVGKREQIQEAMERILEVFANDALRVEADVGKRSKEYQKAWELSSRLQDELEEKLGEKELFEELMDVMSSESSYYAQERFIHGYRLGALMTTEVFMDSDKYFLKGSVFLFWKMENKYFDIVPFSISGKQNGMVLVNRV